MLHWPLDKKEVAMRPTSIWIM